MQVAGQHGHTILSSLAITDRDLQALKANVLHSHVERLEQPQARTVQQPADEQHDAVELGEESAHLLVGQHDGEAPRAWFCVEALRRS